MKNLQIFLFAFLIILSASCNQEEKNDSNNQILGLWHLESYGGGFIGLNCTYERGEVIWNFNDQDQLEQTSNPVNMKPECGNNSEPNSTSALYKIQEHNRREYLFIKGIELGELKVDENTFSINGNNTLQGDGADGFGWIFKK